MKRIVVSACLLGEPCRYDGKSKACEAVCALQKEFDLIPICPEVMGGLPTPRVPSEIVGDRVLMKNGTDVTQNYRLGAQKSLAIAQENDCTVAILKERSPSCGCGEIYDGTFTGTLVAGDGITASLFRENGIRVVGETQTDALLQTP